MSQVPLGSLARVRVGFQFRTEAPYSPTGKYALVQLRDSKGIFSFQSYESHRIDGDDIRKEDLLVRGDVLLRAKGKNHYAVLVDQNVSNTIAGAACLVIRPVEGKIIPGFLTWYLNQPPAQSFLNKISAGTSIPVVNKKALLDLEVPLPSIKVQEAVGELYQLQLLEDALEEKLSKSKKYFLNAKMLQASGAEILTVR